jgi:hypothetical protein
MIDQHNSSPGRRYPLIAEAFQNRKKKAVFWDVTPCRYCVNQHFGRTYRLHLQGRRKRKKIRERGTTSSRLTYYLHGVTSQKTAFFIVTAVKTSNLTFQNGFESKNNTVGKGEDNPDFCMAV